MSLWVNCGLCTSFPMALLSAFFFFIFYFVDVCQRLKHDRLAKEVFMLGEKVMLVVLGLQMFRGLLSLDDIPPQVTTARQEIMMNVRLLREGNHAFFIDVAIRWKSLLSELRAALIRHGLGRNYLNTYSNILNLQATGDLQQPYDPHVIDGMKNIHEANEMEFLRKHAFWCLKAVVEAPSAALIRAALEPDEMVLDYVLLGEYESSDVEAEGVLAMYLVVLGYGQDPLSFCLDSKKCVAAVSKWKVALNKSVAAMNASDSKLEAELTDASIGVTTTILPNSVVQQLKGEQVKHVYIAPDFMLTSIPLELLKDEEGEFVFNTCSVSYITSSRELLREYVLNLVTHWTNELTVASLVDPTKSHKNPHEPNDSNEGDINRLERGRKSQDKDNDSQKELESNISNINKVESVAYDTPGKPQEKFTISGKEDEWDSSKDRKVSLANIIAIGTDESPTEASKLAIQHFNMHANPQTRQRRLVKCSSTESNNTDCVIVCDPNFDLADITFNDQGFIQKLMNLWKPSSTGRTVHQLKNSRVEGNNIEEILAWRPELNVQLISGDDATVSAILRLKSPFLVHISSHGVSESKFSLCRGNFWDDTKSAVVLAGYNTYASRRYDEINLLAGSGMLSALAMSGLDLSETRLVVLSMCLSGIGAATFQESVCSLADAARAAGAQTVVATFWMVLDFDTAEFMKHFYNRLCQTGVRPSQALKEAREEMMQDQRFAHWFSWAPFACYGYDLPLFPKQE